LPCVAPESFQSRAFAVGQDEDPLALMGRANFSRAEYSPRRRVTKLAQMLDDLSESEADMSLNVLEEAEAGLAKSNSVCDEGPEVPGIVCPSALAGGAERLAGVTPREDIHAAVKLSEWERFKITPYRGRIKVPAFHPRRQEAAGILFDLRVSDCSQAWQHSSEPQVDTAIAGAKRDVSELGSIHVIWVKSGQIKLSRIKSSRVKSKRTDCAEISRPNDRPVKWV